MTNLIRNPTYTSICKGDFNDLPQPKTNIVRIFLSSTFTGDLK